MNILVVGNGFDLAHGLPTSYINFLDFLNILHCQIRFPNDRIGCEQLMEKSKLPEELLQVLKGTGGVQENVYRDESLKQMAGNTWIEYLLKVQSKIPDYGWVGFEGEIAHIVKTLDDMRVNASNLTALQQLREMSDILNDSLKLDLRSRFSSKKDIPKIIDRLLQDLDRLIRCLEIYLCICESIPANGKRLRAVLDIGEIHGVLSFNYTNTFERLYAKPLGMNPQYCYIHGRAKEADDISICNMVLGIDEYLGENDRSNNVEFVGFKKYYQRIFKQTDYNYTEWFDDSKPINLYIIGHSLDTTDKDVLSDILLHKGVKTTIFCHDMQANGAQIANLVKVLGYDNFNMLTRGRDRGRSITFSQLLPVERV